MHVQEYNVFSLYRSGNLGYSGFRLKQELTSRDGGNPGEGRTCGAVGGIGPITTSRHKPFSEFKNVVE